MYVWSVAYIVDEYHPWCFINCFVEKKWWSHFKFNNKINWKTTITHLRPYGCDVKLVKQVRTNPFLFCEN
jgi:hypothetical protein